MATYILFDLDGTLIDSKKGITKAVQYALSKYGIEVEDADTLSPFIGPPLRESFKKFYGFDDLGAENAVAKQREYYSSKGIYENTMYDEINEMLEELKSAGKTLILATSKPTVYAEKILKHFNIYDYFSFVSGCELDGRRSRKSEVIQYALEQNHISNLSEVIMIGDREHDIIGAKEVGISCIGVLYGYGNCKELSKAKADVIVKSVSELRKELIG